MKSRCDDDKLLFFQMTPIHYNGSQFVASNRWRMDETVNYLPEADMMLNAQHSAVLRPPETVLYMRNRPIGGRSWYEPRQRAIPPMLSAANGPPYGHYYRNGRAVTDAEQLPRSSSPPTTHDDDNDDDIENHKTWTHYHRYKERRDLFSQLEAITTLLVNSFTSSVFIQFFIHL